MQAPIYLKGGSRRGPTWRETLLMHAVARLVLHPHITNIQASWVKLGPEGLAACLSAGVNDIGGTLMNETITRSAGAEHGQEMTPERMRRPCWLISAVRRDSAQRSMAMRRRIAAVRLSRQTVPDSSPEPEVRYVGQRAPQEPQICKSTRLGNKDEFAAIPGPQNGCVSGRGLIERQFTPDHGVQRAVRNTGENIGHDRVDDVFTSVPELDAANIKLLRHCNAGVDRDLTAVANNDDAPVLGRDIHVSRQVLIGKHLQNELRA